MIIYFFEKKILRCKLKFVDMEDPKIIPRFILVEVRTEEDKPYQAIINTNSILMVEEVPGSYKKEH